MNISVFSCLNFSNDLPSSAGSGNYGISQCSRRLPMIIICMPKFQNLYQNKSDPSVEHIPQLAGSLWDEDKTKEVVEAAKVSMDGARDELLPFTCM